MTTQFCKSFAAMCKTAGIHMEDALRVACPNWSEQAIKNLATSIVFEQYIPGDEIIHNLANYFGIGIDMFYESPHIDPDVIKVYVAGPITGYPDFMERFDTATEYLKAQGYQVFNPARITEHMPASHMTRQNFMDLGLCVLGMCNAIALMPDWQKSTGACMERAYAAANRMKFIELPESLFNKQQEGENT